MVSLGPAPPVGSAGVRLACEGILHKNIYPWEKKINAAVNGNVYVTACSVYECVCIDGFKHRERYLESN